MKTQPLEMTTEAAGYILRRTPTTPWEHSLAREALRVLGRAGMPAWEVEGDLGRKLTTDELALLAGKL